MQTFLLLFAIVVAVVLVLRERHKARAAAAGSTDDVSEEELERLVAGGIGPLREPTILLRTSQATDTNSYLGGLPPDFPGFRWPRQAGRAIGFLACVDLSEVDAIDWLPDRGLLLVFYDLEGESWGFDPEDRHAWAVLYVPDPTQVAGLARAPEDLAEHLELPRRGVAFEKAHMPPPYELVVGGGPHGGDPRRMALADALDDAREEAYGEGPKHQLGGFPEAIQDAAMALDCQLASHGIAVGTPEAYKDPRVADLRAGAKDWRLLLQLDSDDDLGVMWGDLGMVYVWVRTEDARRGDFSGAWVVMQCY